MLSEQFATADYRASTKRPSRYSNSATKAPCAECYCVQHETGGASSRRRTQQVRRTLPPVKDGNKKVATDTGPSLSLCNEHAQLWKERDRANGVDLP